MFGTFLLTFPQVGRSPTGRFFEPLVSLVIFLWKNYLSLRFRGEYRKYFRFAQVENSELGNPNFFMASGCHSCRPRKGLLRWASCWF